MARSIATRTGDDGTTSLLYGQRVPKDHPQIEAVGAFDELNVALGAARLQARDPGLQERLGWLQHKLVALMGEVACAESDGARHLASPMARITEGDLRLLDDGIASLESLGLKFDGWATPGANPLALACEQARVVARRAERRLAALPAHGRLVRPVVGQFVNRLSDLLWLLARQAEA